MRILFARSIDLIAANKTGIRYMANILARKVEMVNVQKIRTSELRYRRLFEAAQDGILIPDAETGAITDLNPFLIKMLGYSRDEFVEKKLWEVGAFKDIEASREAFKALQKHEYIRYEDLPLRAKSGRLIDVELGACCSGRCAGRILPVVMAAMNLSLSCRMPQSK